VRRPHRAGQGTPLRVGRRGPRHARAGAAIHAVYLIFSVPFCRCTSASHAALATRPRRSSRSSLGRESSPLAR
jgi:hypothetical protein